MTRRRSSTPTSVRTAVVVALALLAAACGSAGDGDTDPNTNRPGSPPSVEAVADLALELFDRDLGTTALALLAAGDRGYAPSQVVAAVESGTLSPGGVVVGAGGVVDPARPPEGFIAGKPSPTGDERSAGAARVQLVGARAEGPITFDDLSASFEGDLLRTMDRAVPSDDEDLVDRARPLLAIGTIALLQQQGYTVEQIVLGFVGALVEFRDSGSGDGRKVPYIVGEQPGGESEPVFAEEYIVLPGAGAQPPATDDPDAPVVYRGTGTYTLTVYRSGDDTTFTCQRETTMAVVLAADGTATFSYDDGFRLDMDSGACSRVDGNAWTGSWDGPAGTFTIDPPSPALETWDVGGSMDGREASGPGTYVYTTTAGDAFVRDTHVFEFALPWVSG